VLRRKMPGAVRPYRMWGYPWTLIVFVLVSVWFIVNECITEPVPSSMAIVIVAAGIAAYFLWRRARNLEEARV
jgi:basic amino acid/polyamine antiporter, APA family